MPANPITQRKSLQLDVNEQIECAQTLASRFYTEPLTFRNGQSCLMVN
jgi:hypothetical protein